jgi:hypothetical protein
MCTDDNSGHAHAHDAQVAAAMPRPIEGEAVDPIARRGCGPRRPASVNDANGTVR